MQDAQDTRYQTAGYTELPYQSQKKAEKMGSQVQLPLRTPLPSVCPELPAAPQLQPRACCPLACAGISCHSPLHTPDCAVTVTLLFPQHCTSAHLQQKLL